MHSNTFLRAAVTSGTLPLHAGGQQIQKELHLKITAIVCSFKENPILLCELIALAIFGTDIECLFFF